jgi:glycerol-3-phosphate acyltransferase PlsY
MRVSTRKSWIKIVFIRRIVARILTDRLAPDPPMFASLAFVAAAYLIGSVSFAVVASKLFGLPDPHSYGSGNPGATNVLRTGNKAAAALTLFGDGAKGWLAVYLAQTWAVRRRRRLDGAVVALAAFIGHLFPLFHGFAGGKGVATAAGILIALSWPLGLALAVICLVMAYGFKISSVAALTARRWRRSARSTCSADVDRVGVVPISALLFWRHRATSGNCCQAASGRSGADAPLRLPGAMRDPSVD